jgi:hypothetical protein
VLKTDKSHIWETVGCGFKTNNNTEIAVNKTLISGGSGYKNTAYMSVFMESMQKYTG